VAPSLLTEEEGQLLLIHIDAVAVRDDGAVCIDMFLKAVSWWRDVSAPEGEGGQAMHVFDRMLVSLKVQREHKWNEMMDASAYFLSTWVGSELLVDYPLPKVQKNKELTCCMFVFLYFYVFVFPSFLKHLGGLFHDIV
jgi:hypothetical protein